MRHSLRFKLLALSLMLLSCSAILAIVGLTRVNSVQNSAEALYEQAYRPAVAAQVIRVAMKDNTQQRDAVTKIIASYLGDTKAALAAKETQPIIAAMRANGATIRAQFKTLDNVPDEQRPAAKHLIASFLAYADSANMVLKKPAGSKEQVDQIAKTVALTGQTDKVATAFEGNSSRYAAKINDEAKATARTSRMWILITLALSA